jgi:transposase
MISKPDDLPSELVSALAALQAEREARLQAEAVAASARAELSADEALIAHLELRISLCCSCEGRFAATSA